MGIIDRVITKKKQEISEDVICSNNECNLIDIFRVKSKNKEIPTVR